jgi:hypothetical protein
VGGSDTNEFFNGYIGELLYYQRVLTPTERSAVVGYLRGKWAI